MTATDVVEGKHETTCTCSCGWTLTTRAASPELASQIAAKARANHLADVHPRQQRPTIASPATAPVQVVREALTHGHTALVDAAVKDGILWHRTLRCACGWGAETTDRTPFQADKVLRGLHRRHVAHETDRAPLRDYVVLLGLIAVVMTLCFVLASTAIDVSL